MIHIREGNSQNIISSSDKYLNVKITNSNSEVLFSDSKRLVLTSSKSKSYNKDVKINDTDYSIKYVDFIPNASESIVNIEGGKPVISLLISRSMMMMRQTLYLAEGEIKEIGGITFGFLENDSVDIRISLENDTFKMQSRFDLNTVNMMTQEMKSHLENEIIPFEPMNIYRVKGLTIVPETLSKSGIIKPINIDSQDHQTNKSVMKFEIGYGNKLQDVNLWIGEEFENRVEFVDQGNTIEINYGSMEVELPFSLKLEDFILERYPGSSSPSSYKSNVVLVDQENGVTFPYEIYMNHILKYKGYRFYQSSYDMDEQGTILSVNKDFAGMFVTYAGYFMLILFIVMSLINKHSSFRSVTRNLFKSTTGKAVGLIILFGISTLSLSAQNSKFVVEKSRANDFGKILVQNQQGRTEPLYTLSSDILRKVARETEFEGYSPMQIFLGVYLDFQNWQHFPFIKVSNSDVAKIIGIRGEYAAFSDIVDLNANTYKLKQYIDAAYSKTPGARNKFDKEVIKVDERLNICYMIYAGDFMKVFPVKDSTMKWYDPHIAFSYGTSPEETEYLRNVINLYIQAIQIGNSTGNYKQADEILESIISYQRAHAMYELPSSKKINAEVFYFKSNIYDKLFPFYVSVGFLLLVISMLSIISQNKKFDKIIKIATWLLVVGFLFHTLGLGIRWYVSGHAPMSNGYESMLFISWVTVIAGFIFSRKSSLVLSATSVLAGFTLMVAHLSFMDPAITNLVPVLQSYWLTLHVSVITGSYGFLGLGALIGLIVMILYSITNLSNKNHIQHIIEELTVINYKTLTIGLYLLTIGTFLGAIWANESWGRYWGWDPKETWSLITMIVYSFVIHSRNIDGLKGYYSFNVLALFGFSSVLMTYFGVNYYLSGLHSYASGDPVPVPGFVYISAVLLVSLSFYAFWKSKKEKLN